MDDLAKQVFEQATMLQKRYMDGFKSGRASVKFEIDVEKVKEAVGKALDTWIDFYDEWANSADRSKLPPLDKDLWIAQAITKADILKVREK